MRPKRSEGLTIGTTLRSVEFIDLAILTIEVKSYWVLVWVDFLQVKQATLFAHIGVIVGVGTPCHLRTYLVGDDVVRSYSRQTQA